MYILIIKRNFICWKWEGFLHRSKCLPARVSKDGCVEYWYFGDYYVYDEEGDFLYRYNVESSRIPAVVYSNGTKEYRIKETLHRECGPAIEYINGDCEYWVFGKRHRLDGPAVIYGDKQYWFNDGEFVKCIV